MDRELEQFINKAKKINLSEEDNFIVKGAILNFISQNPVKADSGPRIGWSAFMFTKLNFASSLAILLIMSLMVGSGVAIGAQGSLPGDILYPVKVGVNEEVRGWFAVSEEAKANWEVERAQRRLEEAETMATQGSLDSEAREKIEANFEAHANNVNSRISEFQNKNNFKAAVDVSSKFEASLKAHQKILDRLAGDTSSKNSKEVEPIKVRVKSETDSLIRTRQENESRVENNESEDGGESDTDSNTKVNIRNNSVNTRTNLRAEIEL